MNSFRTRGGFAAVFIFFAFTPAALLHALDVPTRKIEDDSSLRIILKDTWFTETPGKVLSMPSKVYTLSGGQRLEVRSEAAREEFMVILARELTGLPSRGAAGVRSAGGFPGWAQGSWILTRRKDTGEPARIRIFLRSDPYVYIQFRPFSGDKCWMDIVLYDAYLTRSQTLPLPFERLYTLPVEEILKIAGNKFPRAYFDPDPALYQDTRTFVARVRGLLPALSFHDDGAMDENGRYVYIESLSPQESGGGLNCSGFAKWIVDGLLRPLTGERLSIAPLKAPFGTRGDSFTEPWEELRDPFFGLDWIRNLASAAGSVLRSPAYGTLEEIEVREWPFAEVIRRGKNTSSRFSYPGFLGNAGFGVEGLHPLLYTLAVNEPNHIYLAAVNNEIGPPATKDNLRGEPRLRQYFHVAVLVPFFNEYGNFQVIVFESAEETNFTNFKNRYPGCYINLTRVPVETLFAP
jgi:hypothetical protein